MIMPSLPYRFTDRIKSLPFVESLWLYGSRARGDNQPRSDIDLAVWCPRATNEEWQQVLDITEEADTLLKIDIVRLDALHEGPLKHQIQQDMIPL